jgi:hypothetical protein
MPAAKPHSTSFSFDTLDRSIGQRRLQRKILSALSAASARENSASPRLRVNQSKALLARAKSILAGDTAAQRAFSGA